jgi:hypothetical protein
VQLANALLAAELLEKEEAEEVLAKYSEVRRGEGVCDCDDHSGKDGLAARGSYLIDIRGGTWQEVLVEARW